MNSSRKRPLYTIRSEPERQAARRVLNPNVDRTQAQLNQPNASKLHISLHNVAGGDPIDMTYTDPINWSDQSSISALNRWRCKKFIDYLGPINKRSTPARPDKQFTDVERRWLERSMSGHQRGVRYRWKALASEFNAQFGGNRTNIQLRNLARENRVKLARGLAIDDHGIHRKHTRESGP